ncbi:MAG TPA: ADP-ribose pyrophosphatase [Clostridiales bacterium]|nr:ADP-ribose pyrophosphatase [Clostridiales bacterium]
MAGTEERLSSQRVFSGRLIGVRVDEVRLVPDGRTARREVVDHPGAVAVVPLTPGGEVILVRQYRYAVGEALLELPAGTLEPGEDPAACAARELLEETGRRPARLELLASVFSSPGFLSEVVHIYLAELEDEEAGVGPQPEEDERVEVVALPFAAAAAMAREGRLRDAKTVAGLLLAAGVVGTGSETGRDPGGGGAC